ncbi:hypothetical protein GQ464_002745 [Rhodocaloribacter litoris]|uniref:hypothetical protein n=1 Tax=Rhodocaloribacter litoris TaxID=2558931 RepID=UPI001421BD63|nr:hypothetical protein [Rhodocaloribacter litoris]QXD15884.1 hypothetical protein GQ464_002745 [Rhodocaloribacter litoris]
MPSPLVFIHQGFSDYLPFTLRQARAADPENDIYLLGNAANARFPFLHHVDAAQFAGATRAFAQVYRHHSTNRYDFELVCFQRWFLLRAFMRSAGLETAFVLDSDVMLYASARVLDARHIDGQSLGLCLPEMQTAYRWAAFPHVSYWTQATIDRFCDFLMDVYTRPEAFAPFQEKWQYHLRNGLPGGLCDMTALYRFALEHGLDRTANFLKVSNDTTVDLNLNTPENEIPDAYEMAGSIKRLDWSASPYPRGHHRRLGRPVDFLALHCQGSAKLHIPVFYRGPRFRGQSRRHFMVTVHYRLRPLATRLAHPLRRRQAYRRGT